MKHGLVVEDSEVVRKVGRRILEVLGYESSEAEDVQGALDQCRDQMPDLVLLDADLPGGASVEFLRALRREPNGKEPAVLYVLTENNMSQIREAMSAGATDFVMKPIDRELIEAKLTEMNGSGAQDAANA